MVAFNEDAFSAPAKVTEDAFSAPSEINEQSYSDIVAALEAAKVHLDKSSKSFLKCYSSAESSNKHFIRLRSELTMLAVVYKDLHLPLATKVVTDLRDVIMLYAEYDVKKFKENIRGIEKSMSEQAVSAAVLTKVNGLLLLDLNVLHIHMEKKMVFIDAAASMKCCDASNALKEAKRVKETCDAEKRKHEAEKEKCDAEKKEHEAEKKKCDAEKERYYAEAHDMEKVKVTAEMASGAGTVLGMLAVLAGGPVLTAVGGVAGAAVGMGGLVCRNIAEDKMEKATANGKTATENGERAIANAKTATENGERAAANVEWATTHGKNSTAEGARVANIATREVSECLKAVKLIKEDMIYSLTQFTRAMEQISGFLNLLASDTNSYAKRAKVARRQFDQMAQHLVLIKKYVKRIISACDFFVRFQVVVQIRCDSLPVLDGTDTTNSSTKNWCVKHEASGKLQQHELIVLQLLLGIKSVGIHMKNKQGKILQLLSKIWSPKKGISD